MKNRTLETKMGKQTETMKKGTTKLKQAAIAYKAALEWDYCPEPDKVNEVLDLIGYHPDDIKIALEDHQGRRPDEIAGTICQLVDELS